MAGTWREILIDVEPRGKAFRIALDTTATAGDVLSAVAGRCKEEGVDVSKWAADQVGRDHQFVLMRKSAGNTLLAPAVTLATLQPAIVEGEEFVFGTQPVVGGLPPAILNRRVDRQVAAFFEEGLADWYRREGFAARPF